MRPDGDLALVVEAALAAGEVALAHFGGTVEQWEKPAGAGPVSAADLDVNAALRERLGSARPDYGWLSEEDEDTPESRAGTRVFVVDPIDGTRAFLDAKPGFAVSVAVVEAGRPVAGVVHLPAMGRTYAAAAGQGATLDGMPITGAARTHLHGARVLTTSGHLRAEQWPGGVPPVDRHFRSSLAWRLCLVADGEFDALVTLRDTHEWDVAAAALIAGEAGIRVSDGLGQPLCFNSTDARVPGVIAAQAPIHAALIARRTAPA